MTKYVFQNYITHKHAVVIQPKTGDYYNGERWFVEYYRLGTIDYDYRGTQGTGVKVFKTETSAIRSALHYIKQ